MLENIGELLMRFRIGVLLLVVIVFFQAYMVEAMDLLEAWDKARENDPSYRSIVHEWQAAQTFPAQARSQLFPQVQASFSVSEIKFLETPPYNEDFQSEVANVGLRQAIFNAPAWVGYDQSVNRLEAAAARRSDAFSNLFLRLAQAYFNLLYAQENLKVLKEQEKVLAERLEMAKRLYASGEAAVVDVHDAESRYAEVLYKVVDGEKFLSEAQNELESLIGRPPESLEPLGDRFSARDPDPPTVKEWLEIAKERSPVLKYYSANVDVAEKEVQKTWAQHLPTVDFVVSYSRRNTQSDFVETPYTSWYTVGIMLNLPLFSGGYVVSKTRENMERRLQAEEDYKRAGLDVRKEIFDAFYGVKSSRAKIVSTVNAVRAGETATQSASRGYLAGIRTIVDVLDAESNLFRAKADLVQARHEYVVYLISLHYWAGLLDEGFLSKVNGWLEKGSS